MREEQVDGRYERFDKVGIVHLTCEMERQPGCKHGNFEEGVRHPSLRASSRSAVRGIVVSCWPCCLRCRADPANDTSPAGSA